MDPDTAAPIERPAEYPGFVRLTDGTQLRAEHISGAQQQGDDVLIYLLSQDSFLSAGDTLERVMAQLVKHGKAPTVPPGKAK
jgi:hypothetical protein